MIMTAVNVKQTNKQKKNNKTRESGSYENFQCFHTWLKWFWPRSRVHANSFWNRNSRTQIQGIRVISKVSSMCQCQWWEVKAQCRFDHWGLGRTWCWGWMLITVWFYWYTYMSKLVKRHTLNVYRFLGVYLVHQK